jgi:flagellar M-ring protein FliF
MNPLLRFLQLPTRQLIGLAIAIAAVVSLISGAWMWGQTPDYRVLYSNLSDRDGGAVVQALSQMNIAYKFTDGGGAILVPSNQVYDTRLKLASQGLPKGGTAGFEIMEQQKLGTTQFQEQINYQRALEGELAKSVQSLASVQAARVHLAIPKPTVFLREQQKPSASVLVTLYAGKTLDRAQVSGILHLVSSSVPELTAKNVSIIDQNGNLLTSQGDVAGLDPSKLAYMREVEQGYIRRINDILEPITGINNVRAQVTADLDFNQTEQTAETYKPNGKPAEAAVRSQQLNDSSNTAGVTSPAGIPGAQSNQPAPTVGAVNGSAGGSNNSSSHKESTVNYEVDKTVSLTRQSVGSLKRLSTAVVVNSRKVVDAKGQATMVPLEKAQLDQITALVKEAIGFSEPRGDTLNVVNAPFNEPVREAVAEVPIWQQRENIAFAKEIGKNLLVILFALYLVFGVLKPVLRNLMAHRPHLEPEAVVIDEDAVVSLGSASYTNNLEMAKQIARQDPKIVANVVKNWVSNNE